MRAAAVTANVSLRRLRSGHGHPTGKQDPRRAGEPPFTEPGVEAGSFAQAPPRELPQAAPGGMPPGGGNVAPPVRSRRGRFKPALRPDAAGLPDRLKGKANTVWAARKRWRTRPGRSPHAPTALPRERGWRRARAAGPMSAGILHPTGCYRAQPLEGDGGRPPLNHHAAPRWSQARVGALFLGR